MVNDNILNAIDIKNFSYETVRDYEDGFHLYFQVTGSVGEINFTFGEDNEDRFYFYNTEFNDNKEAIESLKPIKYFELDNFNQETAEKLAKKLANLQSQPEKSQLYLNRLFSNENRTKAYFKSLCLRKLLQDYSLEVEILRDDLYKGRPFY